MANKIKVTLTRVYEYDISELEQILKEEVSKDVVIDETLLEAKSRIKALDDFSIEMMYFEENIDDFVGATTEIIN